MLLLPRPTVAEDSLHRDPIQTDLPFDDESVSDVAETDWPGVETVNSTHSYLSSTVELLSQRIDTFFGEDRIYEESTGSLVQVRNNMIINQDGDLDFDVKFRAKLKLPQMKSKFNLLIDNSDEQSVVDTFNRDSKGSSLTDEFESSDVSASLQYMLKQTDRWNVSLRPGIKLSDPINAFLKLRLSKSRQLNKRWLSRGTMQLGYFSEEGWENEWKMEVERRTGNLELFRSTTYALWRENSPGNQLLGQTLLLTHILNKRSSVAFEVGVTGETRPTLRNTSYFGNVRYRRDVHRGWLFFELRPRLIFARENDYDEELSLVLTLEFLLGENYKN